MASPYKLLVAAVMTKDKNSADLVQERARFNFADAVTRPFGFLIDFGFVKVESSPTIVRYRRDDMEANVYWGRQSYEIGFEIYRQGIRYPISSFVRIADPEAGKQYRNFAATTENALAEGLMQLAELVKRYGDRALQGDPTLFLTLEKQQQSWVEEYALEVLEGQLRSQAEEAFRLGNYRKATELYERIKLHLSPAELKKLALAKARS